MPKTKMKYDNEELIRLARNGDTDAEEKLLLDNDRFCFHIAKKYLSSGIDIEDLASLARIGLYKAYKSFNLDKGVKFATYASRCMANEILMQFRKDKKHNVVTNNLEDVIAHDSNGGQLTIMEMTAAPEEDISKDDELLIKNVLDIFYANATDKDKIILERCVINQESQREIAKELNMSQSYVSRLATAIERRLKFIADNGCYRKIAVKANKEEYDLKKQKRYAKTDYIYIIRNYPHLTSADIAKVMGVTKQGVVNYRAKLKKGEYDDIKVEGIPLELKEKLDNFVVKEKTERVKKPKLSDVKGVVDSVVSDLKEAVVSLPTPIIDKPIIAEKEILQTIRKEEVKKDENIFLNNRISITSNKKEIAHLIYGIFELLDKTPNDSKVKLDLHFEVSR